MTGTDIVLDIMRIILAMFWIGVFIQSKKNNRVNLVHIMLLIFALILLLVSFYELFAHWNKG
ncbi:hypothetical protein [Bacillus songklensis]|uniref:hypothetical protein n=1 Tax=Bacillus songklensis TaxID=1069116 RepID=UPI0036708569